MNRKSNKTVLCNVIFPVWLLLSPLVLPLSPLIPAFLPVFLLTLVGNFIIDFLVVWLALRFQGVPNAARRTKSVIIPVWLCGFLADIAGSLLMLVAGICTSDVYYDFHSALMYKSVFTCIPALIYALCCLIVSAALIYRFNCRAALKAADIDDKTRRHTALALAIITAPWTFLLPTNLFF